MVAMTRIVNLFFSAQYIAGFLKRNGSHKYPEIRISERKKKINERKIERKFRI